MRVDTFVLLFFFFFPSQQLSPMSNVQTLRKHAAEIKQFFNSFRARVRWGFTARLSLRYEKRDRYRTRRYGREASELFSSRESYQHFVILLSTDLRRTAGSISIALMSLFPKLRYPVQTLLSRQHAPVLTGYTRQLQLLRSGIYQRRRIHAGWFR